MTALVRRNGKRFLLGLAPLCAAALVGLLVLNACDPGDAPQPPTGPGSVYDPLYDDPRPGVKAWVEPSSVDVPDADTADRNGRVDLLATYRDSDGNPVQGVQMNFTADPASGSFGFDPKAAYTDGRGLASTVVTVNSNIPSGSYALVAYTSPASGGPNAKGQTTLYVNQVGVVGVEDLQITTSSLSSGVQGEAYDQTLQATGGVKPYSWSSSGLPPGLSLNSNSGQISGIPGATGSFSVSVTVVDSNTPPDTDTKTLTIAVTAPAP